MRNITISVGGRIAISLVAILSITGCGTHSSWFDTYADTICETYEVQEKILASMTDVESTIRLSPKYITWSDKYDALMARVRRHSQKYDDASLVLDPMQVQTLGDRWQSTHERSAVELARIRKEVFIGSDEDFSELFDRLAIVRGNPFRPRQTATTLLDMVEPERAR